MNINQVVLTGNLTRDPELRHTPSGKPVCSMRMAVNRGGEQGGVDYLNVIAWNGAGEACAKYLSKGSKVAVTGSIRTGEYEAKDGSGKRYTFEINAQRVEFLSSPQGGGQAPAAVEPSTERPDDDDIPF